MKLDVNSGTGIERNNAPKDTTAFGIGDPAVIIDILRNRLYSRPIQTLVQEYICNARDATREAGASISDIVVTAPTRNSKVFKVRDFGCGLSPERVKSIFVMYGSSTKRSDNTQTGGFGIGAKSAWAYTDSFTIVSYLDGISRHYVAHLGEAKTGQLDLISESPTEEANGTEISIAVKDCDLDQFIVAIDRCILFWPVRPEVKGMNAAPTLPYRYEHDGLALFNTSNEATKKVFSQIYDSYADRIIVQVDGIGYALPRSFYNLRSVRALSDKVRGYNTIIFQVGNGDVEVSASREALSTSEKTQAAIEALATRYLSQLEKHQANVLREAGATGMKQWIAAYRALSTIVNVGAVVANIDGKRFGFSDSGGLSNVVGFRVESVSYSTSYRSLAVRVKLHQRNVQHVNLPLSTLVYVDKPTGKGRISDKLRVNQTALGGGDEKVLLIFPDTEDGYESASYRSQCEFFGAIPLSSLDGSVRERKTRDKDVISVTVRFKGRNDVAQAGIEKDTRTFIYFERAEDDDKRAEQLRIIEELRDVLGGTFCPCLISAGNLKRIEGKKHFIPYATFMKEHFSSALTAERESAVVEGLKQEIARHLNSDLSAWWTVDAKIVGRISDRKLREGISTLRRLNASKREVMSIDHVDFRATVTEALDKAHNLKAFAAYIAELTEYVNRRFYLIKEVYLHKEELTDEVLWYIEQKAKAA